MVVGAIAAKRFRRGDIVVVRDAAEILQTLDSRGKTDGLPFMPEMIQFCGREFTVEARAERLCDTVNGGGCRRMPNVVLLSDLRCDGRAHGGCQAECLLYWNEAWLRSAADRPAAGVGDAGTATADLRAALLPMTHRPGDDEEEGVRFRCQATEMPSASVKVSNTDPRTYVREYTSGNVTLRRFGRVMARASVMQPMSKAGLLHTPPLRGASAKTPPAPPPLNLQPGDWVRVKSKEEIRQTLNNKGTNRGLWFDREMMEMCGRRFQVRRRVERLINDRTGALLELASDCIALEGGVCMSEYSISRWFCPRQIYAYWRECWLERSDPPVPS